MTYTSTFPWSFSQFKNQIVNIGLFFLEILNAFRNTKESGNANSQVPLSSKYNNSVKHFQCIFLFSTVRFSDVSGGREKGALGTNGLKCNI